MAPPQRPPFSLITLPARQLLTVLARVDVQDIDALHHAQPRPDQLWLRHLLRSLQITVTMLIPCVIGHSIFAPLISPTLALAWLIFCLVLALTLCALMLRRVRDTRPAPERSDTLFALLTQIVPYAHTTRPAVLTLDRDTQRWTLDVPLRDAGSIFLVFHTDPTTPVAVDLSLQVPRKATAWAPLLAPTALGLTLSHVNTCVTPTGSRMALTLNLPDTNDADAAQIWRNALHQAAVLVAEALRRSGFNLTVPSTLSRTAHTVPLKPGAHIPSHAPHRACATLGEPIPTATLMPLRGFEMGDALYRLQRHFWLSGSVAACVAIGLGAMILPGGALLIAEVAASLMATTLAMALSAAECWPGIPTRVRPFEPVQRPCHQLVLEDHVLFIDHPDQGIALDRPFTAWLTRVPTAVSPGSCRLGLELRQLDPYGLNALRLRVDLLARDHEALDHLPVYDAKAPLISTQDVMRWLWPLLENTLAIHDEPLPWHLDPG